MSKIYDTLGRKYKDKGNDGSQEFGVRMITSYTTDLLKYITNSNNFNSHTALSFTDFHPTLNNAINSAPGKLCTVAFICIVTLGFHPWI